MRLRKKRDFFFEIRNSQLFSQRTFKRSVCIAHTCIMYDYSHTLVYQLVVNDTSRSHSCVFNHFRI